MHSEFQNHSLLSMPKTNELKEHLDFMVITTLLSCVNVFSIVLNLTLLRFQLLITGLDLSIKILSFNLILSYTMTNICLLVKSILLYSQSDSSISGYDCLMQEFPVIIGYICSTFSLASVVLDRWIATRMCETYSKFGVKIAVVNAMISWPMACLIFGVNLVLPFTHENLPVCLSILAGNKHYLSFALGFNSLLNWSIFLSYRKLVSANSAMLQDFLDSQLYISLSGRLQLRRNIAVANSYLPFILSSALLWLLADFYVLFTIYMQEWSDLTSVITVGYSNHIIGATHSLVYPIIIFQRSRSLRVGLKKCLKRIFNCCKIVDINNRMAIEALSNEG